MNYELGIRVVKNDYFAMIKKSFSEEEARHLREGFGAYACMVGGMFAL